MGKIDSSKVETFAKALENCETFNEKELLDSVKPIILEVEVNDDLSTRSKLAIFSMITNLSNCEEKERKKYAKKLIRLLK